MEVCLEVFQERSAIRRTAVSILVLMEVCLEDVHHVVRRMGTQGFNPCFNGSVLRSGGQARLWDVRPLFQSLF